MNSVEIYSLKDAISTVKDNGTIVDYYLFNEYEIHLNKIPPHSIQQWHYHQQIEEVILVTKGKLKCLYIENQKIQTKIVHEKELIKVKKSIHTLYNVFDQECEFIVFRLILTEKDKRKIFINDKIEVEIKQ